MNSIIYPSDLKSGYLKYKQEIDDAIQRVLNSGWYILGQEVDAFEQAFAHYIGSQYAVGVANGTDALELSLRACGITYQDKVITVSHTAVATVAAIELVGAIPVFVDIDPVTYTIDPNHLEDTIKEHQAKAIIPVHLYGHPADMPSIVGLAKKYGLYIIEDCAQSHGSTINGKKTGTWGDISAFSFYPTKNLGALGDGGAVVTNDLILADKVRALREYGWEQRYISEMAGMNSRLDELQAAILSVKLKYLDQENQQRQYLAHLYSQTLSQSVLVLPVQKPEIDHVYHQYVIRTSKRNELQYFLKQKSVLTLIHYPVPVHQQPAYQHFNCVLPVTEQVCNEILSLPLHPYLKESDITYISEKICYFFKE